MVFPLGGGEERKENVMRERRESDGRRVLDFGAGVEARHTHWLRGLGVDCVAYDCGRNFVPGVHQRDALLGEYRVVFASNVVNTQGTVHGALRTLAEIAYAGSNAEVLINLPDSPRKCAAVTPDWLTTMLGRLFAEVDKHRYSGGVWWSCRGAKSVTAAGMMARLGPLSPEELEVCTIRPVGAVGGRAFLPRVVSRVLGVESEVPA